MSGPAPLPSALLKLRGTYRAHRHADDVRPKPARGAMRCPAWLDDEARAEWKRIVPELKRLGLLTVLDRATLAGFCSQWSTFVRATKLLQDCGDDDLFETRGRRLSSLAAEAFNNCLRAAAQFGLTPSARSRLRAPAPPKPKDGKGRFFEKPRA